VHRFDWLRKNISDIVEFQKTLAGSYLAAHVLGIQDRHESNILVQNGSIFLM